MSEENRKRSWDNGGLSFLWRLYTAYEFIHYFALNRLHNMEIMIQRKGLSFSRQIDETASGPRSPQSFRDDGFPQIFHQLHTGVYLEGKQSPHKSN